MSIPDDTAVLVRTLQNDAGTWGVLIWRDRVLCLTFELPWRKNAQNVSCVPKGLYSVVSHNSAKYKDVWRLEGVPGRTGILFHAGNTVRDIEGCILVGDQFSDNGIKGGQSGPALNRMRQVLPENFRLEIV